MCMYQQPQKNIDMSCSFTELIVTAKMNKYIAILKLKFRKFFVCNFPIICALQASKRSQKLSLIK